MRSSLASLVVSLWLFHGGLAVADEANPHADKAQQLLSDGNYAEAAAEFEAAFQAANQPEFLFQAAEAYRQAGDKKSAQVLYQRYLDAAPSGANVDEANRQLAALNAKPANPGRPGGQTPGPGPLMGTPSAPEAPAPAAAGPSFLDTRLNFTITDENLLVKPGETNPSVPGIRIGPPNSLGVLFFDNYDTRFSGFENLSHVVLYKKTSTKQLDVEGAFVLRLNEFSDVNISVTDDGSYVRLAYYGDPERQNKTNFSLTAFPISGDRFRLGYSYRISWGGSPVFFKLNPDIPVGTSSFVTNSTPAPALKAQYSSDKLYGFVGLKTSTLLDPQSNEIKAVYGALAGGGFDLSPEVRLEANGGFFDRGGNPKQDVLGEKVQLFGGSLQETYHSGMPIGSSVDYALYRNDPESIAKLFQKEQYPGGTSWLVSSEQTLLGQTLQDPEKPKSTKIQTAFAADVNFRLKTGFTRFHADFLVRDLAFILNNVPSFVPFQDFSKNSKTTFDLFGAAGIDQYFAASGLTAGVTAGFEVPSTYEAQSPPDGTATSGATRVVVRSEGNFSILPAKKDGTPEAVAPIVAVKGSAKLDIGAGFATLLDVYYSYDANQTRLTRASNQDTFTRTFSQANQLGFNLTLQARF